MPVPGNNGASRMSATGLIPGAPSAEGALGTAATLKASSQSGARHRQVKVRIRLGHDRAVELTAAPHHQPFDRELVLQQQWLLRGDSSISCLTRSGSRQGPMV